MSSAELIFVYGPPDWPPRYTLYPKTWDVLAFQERLTLCCVATVPVPTRDSIAGELDALLPIEKRAVAVPLRCGLNVNVNEAVWLAASVKENFSPLTANSELVKVSDDTVTGAPLADSSLPLQPGPW